MATILEGLNAISQAVGGTGGAESNLEALNQISEALGGSADAENNADAIVNIAENASGGGSSDFSTATVTITNNSNIGFSANVAHVMLDEDVSSSGATLAPSESISINAILYKGACTYSLTQDGASSVTVTLTGDIEPSPMGNAFGTIYGNGTITITDAEK